MQTIKKVFYKLKLELLMKHSTLNICVLTKTSQKQREHKLSARRWCFFSLTVCVVLIGQKSILLFKKIHNNVAIYTQGATSIVHCSHQGANSICHK